MERVLWLACVGLFAASPLSAQEPQLRATLNSHHEEVWSVAFSPDGRTLASGSAYGTVKLWDVTSCKCTATFAVNTFVMSVAFCPDGKSVASATYCGGIIELWDVAAGKNNARVSVAGAGKDDDPWFGVAGAEKTSLAFSPDGKTLAAASNDEQGIQLLDLATGKIIGTMRHPHSDFPLAYAPDGKTLASGIWPGAIALWDVPTRKNTAMLKGHTGDVTSLAFSPDAKTLASGSQDQTIRLWSVATGKSIATLKGHTGVVHSVAISVAGRTLASGSADKTIRLWDIANGQNTATLEGHTAPVKSVCFSADGRTLASGSDDATIKLWDVKTIKTGK